MEAIGKTYNGEIKSVGSAISGKHPPSSVPLSILKYFPRSYCRAVSATTGATGRKLRANLMIGGIMLGAKAQETECGSEL